MATYNTRDAVVTDRQNIRQKFEVEEIGEHKRMTRMGRRSTDGITKGLVFTDEVIVVPRAWDVYFPSGHSVRIESEKEMIRLGYMDKPPLVDMETGEELPDDSLPLSPKEIVKRNTQQHRKVM